MMRPLQIGEYLDHRLWIRRTCFSCRRGEFVDPRSLLRRHDCERHTRPDLLHFPCVCGDHGLKHFAPVCMMVPAVSMRQAHRLGMNLCITCYSCRRWVMTSPEQWAVAKRPLDRPLATMSFRCIECRSLTGRATLVHPNGLRRYSLYWNEDFGPPRFSSQRFADAIEARNLAKEVKRASQLAVDRGSIASTPL
jgi:hypothetical protein